MSGELTTKVRVVRCPKCRQLLPELPGFDVYKCGGCGTTLQAKKRKSDFVNSKVTTPVAVAAPPNSLDVVMKDDGLGSSTQTEGQNKSSKLKYEQIGVARLSDEKQKGGNDKKSLSGCISEENQHSENGCSSELSLGDNEGSSSAMHVNSVVSVNCLNSTLVAGSDSSWCSISAGEEEALPSTEAEDEGNYVVVEKSQWAPNESDSPGSSTRENHVTVAGNGSCNSAVRPVEDSISSSIVLSSPDNQLQQSHKSKIESFMTNKVNPTTELLVPPGDTFRSPVAQCSHVDYGSPFSSDEVEDKSNNNSPPRVQVPKLQSTNCENNSILKRLSRESGVAANDSNSYVLAFRTEEESFSSSTLVSSSQQLDRDERSNTNSFDCLRSTDTVVTEENVITSSDLITTPREVTNSSTTRGCQADDGSTLSSKSMKGTPSSSVFSSSEQLHQVQHSSFLRSVDEIRTRETVNPSSKLSTTCRNMPKSPTARSLHAYDGNISSCDETEDQFLNQHSTPFGGIYDDSRVSVSEGRPTRNGPPVNRKTLEDLSMQQESGECSSDLSYKRSYAAKSIKHDPTEMLEIMDIMHDNPMYNRGIIEGNEYHSRISQLPRPSRAGFDSGNLSDQFYNDYHYSSSFDSPDFHENIDLEKIRLLKMICELQDQLQRTPHSNVNANGTASARNTSSEICSSGYNSAKADERNFRHRSNSLQNHKLSRIPFSAEASSSRRPKNNPCVYCDAQDWPYTGDLHPPVHRQKNGLSGSQLDYNCCTAHNPFPSSPLRFVDSEFPRWVNETQSEDQGHIIHEGKKFFEEKQTRVRRHCRPIAGGAPFITCYYCSELLQLPEDFLLFRRRYHRLKCSSCSKVLKYSMLGRSHIVSYVPAEIDPPSSMVEMAASVHHPTSTLHSNRSRSSDNVSFSDACGPSVYRSKSSRDPACLSTLHQLHGDVYDRTSSHGYNMPDKRREEGFLRQTLNRYKTTADTDGSAKPSSSKTKAESSESSSPDIAKQPPARNSPLHRLMGYYSPSQVLRGSAASVEGTSSFNPVVHAGKDKPLRREEDSKLTKA